jgi:hypothetical protein
VPIGGLRRHPSPHRPSLQLRFKVRNSLHA